MIFSHPVVISNINNGMIIFDLRGGIIIYYRHFPVQCNNLNVAVN